MLKLPHFPRLTKIKNPIPKAWRRSFAIIAALALLAAGPGAYLLLKNPGNVEAAWFDNSWGFRQKVNLTVSSSASDISNLETLITIDTSTLITAGKLQSSCQDLRFTNQLGKVLPYYIDSGCNTTTTKVWVMSDVVPKNTTVYNMFMYYGNSSAAAGTNSYYFDNVVGLVSYWTLNDGTGSTAIDSSVLGNNGTVTIGATGTQTTTTQAWTNGATGQFSGSLNFDGTDDYVLTNASATTFNGSTTPITIEGWTKYASGNFALLSKGGSSAGGWYIFNNSGTIGIITKDGGGSNAIVRNAATAFSAGVWTHFAIVLTLDTSTLGNNDIKIYSNGVLDQGAITRSGLPANSVAKVKIGARGEDGSPSVFYNSQVDDVKIYTGERTAAQILADKNNTSCGGLTCTIATSSPSTSGPTASFATEEVGSGPAAYWKFDSGTGTSAKDSSANANNGTLGGTTIPTWQTGDQCVSSKCLFFDGSTSKVTGSKIVKGVQSVAFWIRPTTIATQGLLNLDGGTHKLSTNASGVLTATGFSSPTYYLNGQSVTTITLVQNQWNYLEITTATPFDSTSSFTLATDGTNFIKGYIDEFKIYGYARSAAQVQSDFIQGSSSLGSSSVQGFQSQSFLSNGLIGYWKLDESSWTNNCSTGTVLDSSGNGNDMTACPSSTGPTGGNVGKFGYGGTFDGTDDYLKRNNFTTFFANKSGITMSGWVKPSNNPSNHNFYFGSRNDSSADFYVVQLSGSNSLECRFRNSSGTASTTTNTVTPSVWQMITLVYDGNYVTCYVNGVAGAAVAASGVTTSTTDAFFIAGNNANFMNGSIDDVRMYNRALSTSEINQLYNFAPGPVGYWNLNEGTGTVNNDTSGYGGTANFGATSPLWTTGKYGEGLSFDGTNDKYSSGTLSTSLSNSSFTVGGWVYQTAAPAADQVWFGIGSVPGTDTAVHFRIKTTGAILFGFYADDLTSNAGIFTPGQWNYLTFTYDAPTKTKTIYVNGISQAAGVASANFTGNSLFTIGKWINNEWWNGKIDEVKVYNYVRSQSQILSDFRGDASSGVVVSNAAGSSTSTQPASSLMYWKLEEQTGNTINNAGSGGSSYNGTNSGATWLTNTTCKVNGCLNFDTTTDTVSAGDQAFIDSLTGFSTSFWLNPQTLATNKMIVSKANTTTQRVFQIKTDSTTASELKVMIASSASDTSNFCVTNGLGLTASTWQHLVISYDGSQPTTNRINVYKNGNLVTCTVTGTIPTSLVSGTTSNLKLGQGDDTTPTALIGYIDEFKLYTAPLNSSQVNIDYNYGSSLTSGVLGSVESADLSNGTGVAPIGYWNFNENTGSTANDRSGNGNTVTLNGNFNFDTNSGWTLGNQGAALHLDGVDDVAQTPLVTTYDLVGGGNFTVEAWVRVESTSPTINNRIITEKQDATNGYHLALLNNTNVTCPSRFMFEVEKAGTYYSSGCSGSNTAASLNTWYHLVGVFNGTTNTATLYINGQSQVAGTVQSLGLGATGILTFGSSATAGTNLLDGSIDTTQIFGYARTQSQISYDYNRGTPVGYWKIDECQGSTVNDSSGYSNPGTITIGATGSQSSAGTCNTSSTAWGNGATGKFNNSLNFDGTDDKVAVSNTIANVQSVSFWVKPSTSTANMLALTASAYITSSSGTVSATGFSTPSIYVNGNLNGTLTGGSWNHVTVTTNTGITASAITFGLANSVFLNGQIDDVRLYNYALSATQINKVYNNGSAIFYGPSTGSP